MKASTDSGVLAGRVASVDAYRGVVMLLMLAEVLHSCSVSAAVPTSSILRLVCFEQSHAEWAGATLHDLIQPGFYFLVGVGLILSLKRRLSIGLGQSVLFRHALVRAGVLILLGMVLVSVHPRRWTWNFVDTLTQIGLAYPFVFLIALRPRRDWVLALAGILVGYWLLFALFPLPGPDFDYAAVGVPPEWLRAHGLTGFASHWQKNSNAGWAFDRWFLNLFSGDAPYTGAANGLTTLNFIPSIGTMILGLFAGDLLVARDSVAFKVLRLVVTGLMLLASGWLLDVLGVAPAIKAIWTPSWVLFSGGWCFLILAAFHGLVDGLQLARVVFPLTVIGMNSIVAYAMSHVYPALAFNSLERLFGSRAFEILGQAYQPLLYGSAVLLAYWLVLYGLYRRRLFIRV